MRSVMSDEGQIYICVFEHAMHFSSSELSQSCTYNDAFRSIIRPFVVKMYKYIILR